MSERAFTWMKLCAVFDNKVRYQSFRCTFKALYESPCAWGDSHHTAAARHRNSVGQNRRQVVLINGRRQGGKEGPFSLYLEIWYFPSNFLAEKCFFLSFELVKWNFTAVGHHAWKKSFGHPCAHQNVNKTRQMSNTFWKKVGKKNLPKKA